MPHPKSTTKKREVRIKLTKFEKAIIILAKHIERCPYNEYKVEEQILEELGYEKLLPNKKG